MPKEKLCSLIGIISRKKDTINLGRAKKGEKRETFVSFNPGRPERRR